VRLFFLIFQFGGIGVLFEGVKPTKAPGGTFFKVLGTSARQKKLWNFFFIKRCTSAIEPIVILLLKFIKAKFEMQKWRILVPCGVPGSVIPDQNPFAELAKNLREDFFATFLQYRRLSHWAEQHLPCSKHESSQDRFSAGKKSKKGRWESTQSRARDQI